MVLLAALGCLMAGGPAAAESRDVVACESLADLRRLSAAGAERRDLAMARAGTEPGCRLVAPDAVGAVERRAMFGGTPYVCMTVAGAAGCLWVMP